MNKTLKLTLFLALIAALATGLLAAVNQMTEPVIKANEAENQTAELKVLYPEASTFEPVEFTDTTGLVKEAYKVDDQGYVFKVASQGYSSELVFIIGYNNDGSNSKFKMLSNQDTAGFGQRLMEDSYQQAMTGKSTSDAVEVLSGATKSSNAVVNGVNAAVAIFNELTGSTATPSAPVAPEKFTEIVSKEEVDGATKYLVDSEGFDGNNTIAVVVKDGIVESVSFEKFVDSDPEGKNADKPEFLDLFKGIDLKTQEVEVDTHTGSTWSSDSVLNAVKAVKAELTGTGTETTGAQEQPAASTAKVLETKEEGTSKVFLVEAEGFHETNVISVKISADGVIEEVKFDQFNDSKPEGEAATKAEFLDQFKGLNIKEEVDVDVKNGSTWSSNSVLDAVKKAITEFGGQQ